MTLYTTSELAALRDCQEAFMDDACQVGTITATQNGIGEYVDAAPSYGTEQACGLEMLAPTSGSRAEFRTEDGTVAFADARLRLAYDASVGIKDVVKITKRHGATLSPAVVYEVLGTPAVGVSGTVCYLRKVTT